MINHEKYNPALRALHDIFVRARSMAAKSGLKELHALMDDAEILPKYIAMEEDKTLEFQLGLESIGNKVPSCKFIVDRFDTPDNTAW